MSIPIRYRRRLTALLALVVVSLLLAGCPGPKPPAGPPIGIDPGGGPGPTGPTTGLTVSFIDVGQADSILLQSGDAAALIDAGNNADGQLVVDYLKQRGVTRLSFVIGTHPHEDHIGGLDNVLRAFAVDRVYMPEVTTTTRTFEDVLLAVRDRQLKITAPEAGDQFTLGGATCTILGPLSSEYESLNDYSIILRVTCGATTFLFTGDAGKEAEAEQLAAGNPLTTDVLKVGHHGSGTSSSAKFLAAVRPSWAVISVGVDNDYGHPHQEALSRLVATGATVLRTDESGTIVISTDGKTVSVEQR